MMDSDWSITCRRWWRRRWVGSSDWPLSAADVRNAPSSRTTLGRLQAIRSCAVSTSWKVILVIGGNGCRRWRRHANRPRVSRGTSRAAKGLYAQFVPNVQFFYSAPAHPVLTLTKIRDYTGHSLQTRHGITLRARSNSYPAISQFIQPYSNLLPRALSQFHAPRSTAFGLPSTALDPIT